MITRDLSEQIKEHLRYFPVITFTGPRQSGKTTLIRDMMPDLPYYTLKNPATRILATSDPMTFSQPRSIDNSIGVTYQ